jgi:hypothetical protein
VRRRRSSGGADAGTQMAVKTGAGLNHVQHGKLPCGLGKMLGRHLGSEDRRRGELGGGRRGNSGFGDRAARLDQQATRGAFVVHKEGLKSLRG